MSGYPSLKAKRLLAILQRSPLNYVTRRSTGGSHRILESPDRPRLIWAFHDKDTLAPGMVRKILTKDVGLTDEEAHALL